MRRFSKQNEFSFIIRLVLPASDDQPIFMHTETRSIAFSLMRMAVSKGRNVAFERRFLMRVSVFAPWQKLRDAFAL